VSDLVPSQLLPVSRDDPEGPQASLRWQRRFFDDLTPGLSLRITPTTPRTWTLFYRDKNGRVEARYVRARLSLVERPVRDRKVAGSNPNRPDQNQWGESDGLLIRREGVERGEWNSADGGKRANSLLSLRSRAAVLNVSADEVEVPSRLLSETPIASRRRPYSDRALPRCRDAEGLTRGEETGVMLTAMRP
jgi:hypothetical protein